MTDSNPNIDAPTQAAPATADQAGDATAPTAGAVPQTAASHTTDASSPSTGADAPATGATAPATAPADSGRATDAPGDSALGASGLSGASYVSTPGTSHAGGDPDISHTGGGPDGTGSAASDAGESAVRDRSGRTESGAGNGGFDTGAATAAATEAVKAVGAKIKEFADDMDVDALVQQGRTVTGGWGEKIKQAYKDRPAVVIAAAAGAVVIAGALIRSLGRR